jgi:hypothetical protein
VCSIIKVFAMVLDEHSGYALLKFLCACTERFVIFNKKKLWVGFELGLEAYSLYSKNYINALSHNATILKMHNPNNATFFDF